MIPRIPFGRTGHDSTRLIFGAAALHSADERSAARALELLLTHDIDHIDVAASYGEAEDHVGRWMPEHRERFFLATKTGERSYGRARDQIRRSLERLRTDRLDLLQLHNLVDEAEHEQALSHDGALRAAVEAREEGLVRFIGVTGHGTRVADMHLRSLERFPFYSVLLPWNPTMLAQPAYAREAGALRDVCHERGVAVQTIKAVARRRWPPGSTPGRTTWYEPLENDDAFEQAVHFVLAEAELFLNTASDLDVFERTIAAAERFRGAPDPRALEAAMQRAGAEALFLRGFAA